MIAPILAALVALGHTGRSRRMPAVARKWHRRILTEADPNERGYILRILRRRKANKRARIARRGKR